MLTIWGRTNSVNVQKVMWAVGELGLDHRRIDAGGAFGGLDSEAYGRMNPNRRIPVVDDNGASFWESNAVVRYLARTYGKGSLDPDTSVERGQSDMWMDWMLTVLMPDMHPVFWGLIRTAEAKRDMGAIDAAVKRLGTSWQILDAHLASRPFVAGQRLTMGDIPVGAAYWRYLELPIDRPDFSNLSAWFEHLRQRPAYAEHVMIPLS